VVPGIRMDHIGHLCHHRYLPGCVSEKSRAVLSGGVELAVSGPHDEPAQAPDIISCGGADFSAFALSRWPGLVRLAYGLTGDQRVAEGSAQTALASAYTAWRRISRADDPDAYPAPHPDQRQQPPVPQAPNGRAAW
jgi:hypothetical protein